MKKLITYFGILAISVGLIGASLHREKIETYAKIKVNQYIQEKVSQEVKKQLDIIDINTKTPITIKKEIHITQVVEQNYQEMIPKLLPMVVQIVIEQTIINLETEEETKRSIGGTGVFISKKGYILTCAHLFKDYSQDLDNVINITFYDKTKVEGKLLAKDLQKDLALVKLIDYEKPVPFLWFTNSDKLRQGQKVLVIGNPGLYYNWTVTQGMITGLHRTLTTNQGKHTDLIQSDALISGGNSGGPIIGMDGKIIGITAFVDHLHSLFVSSKTVLIFLKKHLK